MSEELEYSSLLDQANTTTDPVQRLLFITAFAIASYSSYQFRTGTKPFNPLMGETYELIHKEMGFRYVSEQISHNPPIMACYADSPNYTFSYSGSAITKFWGMSFEITRRGNNRVLLKSHNEIYEWNKVTACVYNMFNPKKRWFELFGKMVITCNQLTSTVEFVKVRLFHANDG